ncbi:ketoacyl-ACP synthase III [Paenibacillus glycanilyticus]|uniref:Beta-ketoacyl-[acyl-carrier-protein] synthase III n=1 Tax=Paenibacillus glycanilyticus TaxID=126569 RepID=A0ABQ6G900_9BACL|nr:ketoacyl-ACP synthase III [Paenibacillus glycanilyticus]GLX67092.1 3-oxoacyl-[acyl-carrier-protein] synthase 3 protein 2 [Paenibacillus glycanilyticus]
MEKLLQSNAVITAIGTYTPEKILSNADLEQLVETSDEWIVQRTGIRERRIAADHQFTSDLCVRAARDMQQRYGVQLEDVDYVIVATSTPDNVIPSVAAQVQAALGIRKCGAIDIQAACAGFTSAIQLANGLLLSGVYRKILVIGGETLSKVTNYEDRTTCILFGDGAGAFLMEAGAEGDILAMSAHTDGSGGHHVYRSGLSTSINAADIDTTSRIVQNGREVYKWALSQVSEGIAGLLRDSGYTPEQINWFVPHNANQRIIDALCERTGISEQQALSSIEHYGNTSAASIPLALDAAVRDGRVLPGHVLLLYGFGGGLTQSGVLLRWSI